MPSIEGTSGPEVDRAAIIGRVTQVRERIARACGRAGRGGAQVDLVAVTKGRDLAQVNAALEAGVTDLGENTVQEAATKAGAVGPGRCRWHFVGHLQRNKVAAALRFADMVQSVDSIRLAEELSRRAQQQGRPVECLVEVNVSGEASKFGVPPDDLVGLVEKVMSLPRLELRGLMTVAPWGDRDMARRAFAGLRELGEDLKSRGLPARHLSMGMSDDFEVAIEEGSTMVRIGTAIFGSRTY